MNALISMDSIRLCPVGLHYVDGLGEPTSAPGAAAELAEDAPVLSWAFARSPGLVAGCGPGAVAALARF